MRVEDIQTKNITDGDTSGIARNLRLIKDTLEGVTVEDNQNPAQCINAHFFVWEAATQLSGCLLAFSQFYNGTLLGVSEQYKMYLGIDNIFIYIN
jgi:hypothetical protein